jgi:O-Antigen ligase
VIAILGRGQAESVATAVTGVVRTRRLQVAAAGALLVLMALLLGPLGGRLAAADHAFAVAFVGALLVPVLFWRVPAAPVVMFTIIGTSIERFSDPSPDAITAKVPLFRSFAEVYGISGAIVTPVELLIVMALLIWLARSVSERNIRFRASPLGVGIAVVFSMAIAMELFGLSRGGIFNISLWELRPFLYVSITYLLASQLVGRREALEAILWGMVIGTGLKGIEGTERVFTLANAVPRPEAILEHDESFFFSIFIAITVALWLFGKRGWLRRVATLFLPLVLMADLGNNRRAAWVMLPAMLLALAIITYVRTPHRRKLIAWVVGVLLVLGIGYVLVFRNSTALIAEPAHAVWSQFQPDPRDSNSNLYRQLENANLAIDIKVSAFTGTGFGVPIAHPIPLYDASNIDPLINFIPHNNILYVWLRMGTVGMVAFWWLIGAAIVASCRLARHPDRTFGLFGSIALMAVMAWLVQGYLDVGITSFRIVLVVGSLLGAVAAAHRMAVREAAAEAAAGESPRAKLRVLPPPGSPRERAAVRSLTGS